MNRPRHPSEPSSQTREEAVRIARGSQQPGQSKEETKRITQGIEKGIALYKKQQKAKARERDKRQKQARQESSPAPAVSPSGRRVKTARLPWILLGLSWSFFGLYLLLSV